MSAKNKDQSNTLQGRLEAQLKAKALRFPPGSIVGALETPSRVKMNAKTGALDCVSSAMPSSVFFALDAGRCRHRRNDNTFRSIKANPR